MLGGRKGVTWQLAQHLSRQGPCVPRKEHRACWLSAGPLDIENTPPAQLGNIKQLLSVYESSKWDQGTEQLSFLKAKVHETCMVPLAACALALNEERPWDCKGVGNGRSARMALTQPVMARGQRMEEVHTWL